MISLFKYIYKSPPVIFGKHVLKNNDYLSYTSFIKQVKQNQISSGVLKSNENVVYFENVHGLNGKVSVVENSNFWNIVEKSRFDLYIDNSKYVSPFEAFLSLLILVYIFVMLRSFLAFVQNNSPGSNQKVTATSLVENVETTLDDVEGIDNVKNEIEDVVDFLRNPTVYQEFGATVPRGVLLSGSPGTGKTLLARAIAGESNVPFIQCSGSDFIEVFVGVGAKRVRDMFTFAKKHQPCIIFIDEIDSIGKKRDNNNNSENDQTINQLLTEMDGFVKSNDIIVIAATNRIDILDDALLRPGRFDRKIEIALPNREGRERILRLHFNDKILNTCVDIHSTSQLTTGFSGAELANLANECAIYAVKKNKGIITNEIIEETFQRIIIGIKSDSNHPHEQRELVAYHESGHALIGALMNNYDTISKVSIVSRGSTGGVTVFKPKEDSSLVSKSYLISKIKVLLGGRVAEEIVYGENEISTGASSDYQHVNSIAKNFFVTYNFGKYNFDRTDMSEKSKYQLDEEIDKLIRQLYNEVRTLLRKHRSELEQIKLKLMYNDMIDGTVVYKIIDDSKKNTDAQKK